MYSISIKAVILASLAVLGIDLTSNFVLNSLFGGPLPGSRLSQEQVRAAMLVLYQDSRYLTFALVLGTASTVLGGFLAARLARTVPYFNALAFGALGLLLGLIAPTDVPTLFRVLALALTLPAALLGGHIAKLRAQV